MAQNRPFVIFRGWPLHLSINEGKGPINFCITFDIVQALCFVYLYIKVCGKEWRIEKFFMYKNKEE